MSDDDNDKTEEIKEQLEEGEALGGDTDSDSDMVLTLDGGDDEEENEADGDE